MIYKSLPEIGQKREKIRRQSLSGISIGLNLMSTKTDMGRTVMLGLEAVVLLAWLIHGYLKHNIKDFI